jgi:peroxiredoxin
MLRVCVLRGSMLGASILAASMLAASWALPASAAETPSLVGKDAPDFVLKASDGSNLRLSEFRGQVVLVNFWARWAGDTHREMRALDKINTTYQRAGLVVLGISIDEDLRRAQEFAESMKVSYPILFDTGSDVGRDYQLAKLPVTLLVDRSGVVRFSHIGFKRGDDRIYLEQIRELLRE